MCGISFILIEKKSAFKNDNIKSSTFDVLKRRGPDIQNTEEIIYKDLTIILYGSTLYLQGNNPTLQPLHLNGNKLLWNGEIFGGIEVKKFENDGMVLLQHLSSATSAAEILHIFSLIKGPWAFIFKNFENNKIWFGRDIFGRRSLVYHFNTSTNVFIISSTALKIVDDWLELPAIGIYCMDLESLEITIFPYYYSTANNITAAESSELEIFCDLPLSLTNLKFNYKISHQCVIFPFVFYSDPTSSERKPTHSNLILRKDVTSSTYNQRENIFLDISDEGSRLVGILEELLSEAVRIRVSERPKLCSRCIASKIHHQITLFSSTESDRQTDEPLNLSASSCDDAKCCILFSGGIDSLVIAALAHRYVSLEEPIDLLNVMFTKYEDNKSVPSDRTTSIEAVEELNKIFSNRKWNLIHIDVDIDELQTLRKAQIQQLIYPLSTVLDDSIGCALWFASRGSGYIMDEKQCRQPYTSSSRVILSGLGADEQLAGYSRHRLRFKEGGYNSVGDELKMELRRISSRNLGRDDRVISDHGREVRFPFLDEHLVEFLASLPVESKTDLSLDRGIGDKLLLRMMAHRIGLIKGATREKRAIQFGSGIAKLEKQKENGSDICLRLK